jgi:hypothetical protein
MYSYTYRFEELPLFDEGGFVTARVDGEAELSFNSEGHWHIEAVCLVVDNDKTGEDATVEYRPLHRGTIWWRHVTEALERRDNPDIGDRIAREVELLGLGRSRTFARRVARHFQVYAGGRP